MAEDQGQGIPGQLGLPDPGSDFNAHAFLVRQMLGEIRTMIPVKVIAVHGGGLGPPPTVDVQPLVKQMDGLGQAQSHGTIYGIPCTRNQAGGSVVINDPKVDDIGMMSVADRDISSLKANKGQESNPGSYRRHHLGDGVYHGPLLNQTKPTQYVQFRDDGLTIQDVNQNTIETSQEGIKLNGVLIDRKGNIKAPGNVTAGDKTGDSVTLQHHVHGASPPPTPGT